MSFRGVEELALVMKQQQQGKKQADLIGQLQTQQEQHSLQLQYVGGQGQEGFTQGGQGGQGGQGQASMYAMQVRRLQNKRERKEGGINLY